MGEDIELAAREVFGLKLGGGLSDRHNLGVSSRVVGLRHLIDPLRERFARP